MIRFCAATSIAKCLFILLPITLLLSSFKSIGQIDRSDQPVVIPGDNLPCILGKSPSILVGFKYDKGTWVQRPVQLDERAWLDVSIPYNWGSTGAYDILFYTDTSTFTGADPDPTIDENDELVFMFRDAGDRATGIPYPSGTIPGSQCEIAVYDQLNQDTVFFYLFDNNGSLSQDAGEDYVSYNFNLLSGNYKQTYNTNNGPNAENTTYETDYYKGHFADRWVHDELYINDGNDFSDDLLDRHKNFFFPGICGRTEDSYSQGGGCIITNVDGPVRAIRSYFGANSGPFSQRTHKFYERTQSIRTDLRVHYIISMYDVFDYSENVLGSEYFNSNNLRFDIDGVPDMSPINLENDWEAINIPNTGHIHHSNWYDGTFEKGPDGATGNYWEDNTTNPLDTCTGDDVSIGASGHYIEFEEFICTEILNTACTPEFFRTLGIVRIMNLDQNELDEQEAAEIDSSNTSPFIILRDNCNDSFASITEADCSPYRSPSGKEITMSGIYLDTILNSQGCDSIITIDLTILPNSAGSLTEIECNSYTSPSGKYIWDQSGIYLDTIPASNGCDSIITIDLTILPDIRSNLNVSQCEPYTSPSGKYIWDQSGTYFDTVPAPSGCDTFFTIDLTILPDIRSNLNVSQCEPYTSPSGKYIWDQSGTYFDTVPAPSGCDTFFTIDLTILPDIRSNLNVSQCEPYTSPSGKYIWDQSGTYFDTVPAPSGCDTFFTIDLTILPDIRSNLNVSQCEPYTSPSGKYIWDQSGTYFDTVPAPSGCDTFFTIDLTILPDIRTNLNVSQCEPYTSPSGKYIWDQSGTYFDTVPAPSGCDTFFTIDLTILPDIRSNLNVSQCEPYTSPSGKYIWDQSGTYLDTIPANNGCDSIITIDLTILPDIRSNLNVSQCEPYTSPSGKYIWDQSGTYFDTVPAPSGCDTFFTIDLTILPDIRSNLNVSQCEPYTSPSGKYIWDQSGTYFDTVPAPSGCDTFFTIDLTILPQARSNIAVSACAEYLSPSGKYIWDQSGTYSDTLVAANGCDSIVGIDLDILPEQRSNIVVEQCGPYISPSGRYTWDQSGNYLDTVQAINGCDSIILINLTIFEDTQSLISISSCDSYTSPSGKYIWDESGDYLDTLTNSAGCDSVLIINLNINESSRANLFVSQCQAYTAPSGKFTWRQSGNYLDTIPSSNGCDSVLEISLQILELEAELSFDGDSLIADTYPGAVYSWLDCGDFSEISSGFDPWFVPGVSGEYAVHIEFLDCSDTSSCIKVDISSVGELPEQTLVLYPNPATDRVCLLTDRSQIPDYRVVNQWGEVVLRGSSKCVDVSRLTGGVYQMIFENNLRPIRFVKLD